MDPASASNRALSYPIPLSQNGGSHAPSLSPSTVIYEMSACISRCSHPVSLRERHWRVQSNYEHLLQCAARSGDLYWLSEVVVTIKNTSLEDTRAILSRALLLVVKLGKLNEVKVLLDYGADPNWKDSEGYTALFHIPANGDDARCLMNTLCLYGADVHAQDCTNHSILYYRLERNLLDGCTLLVELGASLADLPPMFVQKLLDCGVCEESPECIRRAFCAGADPDAYFLGTDRTYLSVLCERKTVNVVCLEELIKGGVDCNKPGSLAVNYWWPPLFQLCGGDEDLSLNREAAIRALMNGGAHLMQSNPNGVTVGAFILSWLYQKLKLPLSTAVSQVIAEGTANNYKFTRLVARCTAEELTMHQLTLTRNLLSSLFSVIPPGVDGTFGYASNQRDWALAMRDWMARVHTGLRDSRKTDASTALAHLSLSKVVGSEQVLDILCKTVVLAREAVSPASTRTALQKLAQNRLFASFGGWYGHFAAVVTYVDHNQTVQLARCNRGENADPYGIRIEPVTPHCVDQVVSNLLPLNLWKQEDFVTIFQGSVQASSSRVLPMSRQVVGNCSAATWSSMLRAIAYFYIDLRHTYFPDEDKKRYAKEVQKFLSQCLLDAGLFYYLNKLNELNHLSKIDSIFLARILLKEKYTALNAIGMNRVFKEKRAASIRYWLGPLRQAESYWWNRTLDSEKGEVLFGLIRARQIRENDQASLVRKLPLSDIKCLLDWLMEHRFVNTYNAVKQSLSPQQVSALNP